jgi:hypothetical protein
MKTEKEIQENSNYGSPNKQNSIRKNQSQNSKNRIK